MRLSDTSEISLQSITSRPTLSLALPRLPLTGHDTAKIDANDHRYCRKSLKSNDAKDLAMLIFDHSAAAILSSADTEVRVRFLRSDVVPSGRYARNASAALAAFKFCRNLRCWIFLRHAPEL
jgi:hypothetical protein